MEVICAILRLRLLRSRCVFSGISFSCRDADADGDGRTMEQKEAGSPSLCGRELPTGQGHPLCTAMRTINKLLLP